MGKASRKKRGQQPEQVSYEAIPKRTNESTSFTHLDLALAASAAFITGAVYWKTLCPTIYTTGAGENVTAAAILGVPHPPGFPLFCILGKFFTLILPLGEVAYRVNLFSALCGAIAVATLFLALRFVGGVASRAAALSAAQLFAVSRTFWSQAVIAEVYTLNALILLLILLFLLKWDTGGSLAPAAFCFGLGLAVHPLQILFLPGWLYFIRHSKQKSSLSASVIARTAGWAVLGLLLHLYTPIRSRSNPTMDWGNPENLRNFFAYLTASQYRGRMFSLPLHEVLTNLLQAGRLLSEQFTIWLFPLPVAGAWMLFRKDPRLFWTTLISAVITILYAANYNIPWEIDVYYIPVALVFAIWSFWILRPIAARLKQFSYALPLIALLPFMLNLHFNDRSDHRLVLAYGKDLLKSCPSGSNVIVPDTDAVFALLYLTAVERQRQDVKLWVEGTGGIRPFQFAVNPDVKPITYFDLVRRESQAIFISHRIPPESIPGYALIPSGILHRIVPKGSTITTPVDFGPYELEKYVNDPSQFYLDDRSKVILANYLLSRGDYFLARGQADPARKDYARADEIAGGIGEIESELAAREADSGDSASAIERLRAAVAAGENAVDYNRLGRLLAKSGQLDEAMAAFKRAIELDPNFAMAHSNLGAAYGAKGDLTRALRELETALRLDPNNPLAHNNLARASLLSGNRERAIAALQRSLVIDPAQPQVRKQLQELGSKP